MPSPHGSLTAGRAPAPCQGCLPHMWPRWPHGLRVGGASAPPSGRALPAQGDCKAPVAPAPFVT